MSNSLAGFVLQKDRTQIMILIMKILVLMDSFKGSLTSMEAGQAIKEGILAADSQTEVTVYPFADGGEGTLDAFLAADKSSKKTDHIVSDPLGRMIESGYGILGDGTAVIEMAEAAGLCLLEENMLTIIDNIIVFLHNVIKSIFFCAHSDK